MTEDCQHGPTTNLMETIEETFPASDAPGNKCAIARLPATELLSEISDSFQSFRTGYRWPTPACLTDITLIH